MTSWAIKLRNKVHPVLNLHRKLCTIRREFQEIKIPVPWGHIAGKWWEPFDKRPILTLHGWQDNCGSFDRLIPLLTQDVGFLTIDSPGHGYSSRLQKGMYYDNLNYPILIRRLMNYFGWPKISLMGHSLGAISCYFYTMIFPHTVDFIVCIDGAKPLYKKDNPKRMGEGINELLKYDKLASSDKEPPSYPLELIKEKVSTLNNNSINIEHAGVILERNLVQSKTHPGKYFINRDPRLKSRLIINWDEELMSELSRKVTCPLLMLKATQSGYFEKKENFYNLLKVLKEVNSACEYHYVEGTHHVHLNEPEVVAKFINDFLTRYNTGDRSVGKMANELNDIG